MVGTTSARHTRLRTDVVGVIGSGALGEEICAVRVLNFSSFKAGGENLVWRSSVHGYKSEKS